MGTLLGEGLITIERTKIKVPLDESDATENGKVQLAGELKKIAATSDDVTLAA